MTTTLPASIDTYAIKLSGLDHAIAHVCIAYSNAWSDAGDLPDSSSRVKARREANEKSDRTIAAVLKHYRVG